MLGRWRRSSEDRLWFTKVLGRACVLCWRGRVRDRSSIPQSDSEIEFWSAADWQCRSGSYGKVAYRAASLAGARSMPLQVLVIWSSTREHRRILPFVPGGIRSCPWTLMKARNSLSRRSSGSSETHSSVLPSPDLTSFGCTKNEANKVGDSCTPQGLDRGRGWTKVGAGQSCDAGCLA